MRFCGNCGTRLESAAQTAPTVPTEPAVPRADTSHLGVMMGSDLLERFRQAGLQASGQRRNVTILFVDLTGYTRLSERLDSEALYDLIQQYIRVLVNTVYKYEGAVDKLTGDGLMALFGAPIAYENNAERAVRAALDMQVEVEQLSAALHDRIQTELQIHVGLNCGTVVVGGVGSDSLMNYTAIGDTVNLARRLEEAAGPGTILVSESVFHVTRQLFNFDIKPPLELKGISHPVPAYAVTGVKAQPGSVRGIEGLRSPMIGRDQELSQAIQVVENLSASRQGHILLVIGEAGMGKSRLTAELKARVRPDQVRILEGQSLTYRKSMSYWIYQEILRSYLGLSHDIFSDIVRSTLTDAVTQVLGPEGQSRLAYLEYVFGLDPSDPSSAETIRYLDPGQLHQQVLLSVRDFLVALARQKPLMIILEDLHWADEASVELTLFLMESVRKEPLLIFANSRPHEGGGASAIQDRAKKRLPTDLFSAIRLKALKVEQSTELFHSLLAIPELPTSLRDQIIARSAGLPFYLEEILRMLIENHVIFRDGPHWRLTPGADFASIGVPETLQGLILTRFDRQTSNHRRVLQTASVIGQTFNVQVLDTVLGEAEAESTRNSLADLVEREFISRDPDAPDVSFSFKHVLVTDAIYGTLLLRDRKNLHGRVGQAIETLYAGRLEGMVELLANHYLKSFMLDRALDYLIQAGEKSARNYANAQARQQFEQALEVMHNTVTTLHQVLQVRMGLGDVLTITGEYIPARNHYLVALKRLAEDGKQDFLSENAVFERKVAATYERQGDYDQAVNHLVSAQKTLDLLQTPMPIEQSRILNDLGWIFFRRGNIDQADQMLSQALEIAIPTNHLDVIASIYNRLGGIHFQKEKFTQALEAVRKSLELRKKIGDIVAVARTYNNLGLLNWKRGDWDEALADFDQSFHLHANLGDVEGMIELHTNMGLILLDRDQIDAARQHFVDALASAQQIGHTYHIGLQYMHLALLSVETEDWLQALEYSVRGQEAFNNIGVSDHSIELFTYTGMAWLGLADYDQAAKWGRDALELFNRLEEKSPGLIEDRGRALRLLGDVSRASHDFSEAARQFEESAAIFEKIGNVVELGRTRTKQAHLASDQGNPAASSAYFELACNCFKEVGAMLDLRKLCELQAKFS